MNLATEHVEEIYGAPLDVEFDRRLAEASLKEFTVQAFENVLEPSTVWKDNWHIDAICDHLQAVYDGDIKRLLINIPPRTAKSTITSVTFPAWCWINRPDLKFLCASYAQNLSIRDAIRARKIIQSPWYQENWGDRFMFESDQNAKTRYNNDKSGYRIATSVGAMVTGEGGDINLIDDPHNVKDTFSERKRIEVTDEWWDLSMSTRFNDPITGAVVIIMQRVHNDDLSGHVLKTGDYDHLCLPMEYELEERSKTFLDFKDPRTKQGELLHADRWPEKELASTKLQLRPYGVAGQFQQRPVPLTGGIINIDWFKRYYSIPPAKLIKKIFQSWDTASKDDIKNNAPWVGITFVETIDNRLLIVEVVRKWMLYPEGLKTVKSYAEKWAVNEVVIEDKSTGESLIPALKEDPDFIPAVIAVEPVGDKMTRLSTESAVIEEGIVHLPESAPWLFDFELEIGTLPNCSTKDQGDALSQGLKHRREKTSNYMEKMKRAMQ